MVNSSGQFTVARSDSNILKFQPDCTWETWEISAWLHRRDMRSHPKKWHLLMPDAAPPYMFRLTSRTKILQDTGSIKKYSTDIFASFIYFSTWDFGVHFVTLRNKAFISYYISISMLYLQCPDCWSCSDDLPHYREHEGGAGSEEATIRTTQLPILPDCRVEWGGVSCGCVLLVMVPAAVVTREQLSSLGKCCMYNMKISSKEAEHLHTYKTFLMHCTAYALPSTVMHSQ